MDRKNVDFEGIQKTKKKNPIVIIFIAILLVAICVVGIIFVPKYFKKLIPVNEISNGNETAFSRELLKDSVIQNIEADKTEGNFIKTDTSFTVKSSKNLSEDEIKSYLSVSPDVNYEITKKASCTYSMKLNDTLPSASVLKLSVKGDDGNVKFSWAFQTIDKFRIKSTYPTDESEYVPVNTGIELYFSEYVKSDNFSEYFEISPKVDGHFEYYRSTIAFVPDKDLDNETVYTITVKKGFTSCEGMTLDEDTRFHFKTEMPEDYLYFNCYSGISETFLPDDVPVVEVYTANELEDVDYDLNLYKYPNADSYMKALQSYCDYDSNFNDYVFPTEGLENVLSTKQKPIRNENEGFSPSFFLLPENLEEGYYLADIKTEYNGREYSVQSNIQISSISVYANTLPDQSALFINDTVTGNAASGAKISFYVDGKTANEKTDNKGTATTNFDKTESHLAIVKVEYNSRTFIETLSSGYSPFTYYNEVDTDAYENYYIYLYTDRETYLPTDTVNVWGMIRKRTKDSADIPTNLSIRLGYDNTDGKTVPIKVESDGTFKTSVSFARSNEYYSLPISLISGETILRQQYLTVMDYVKPTYVINASCPIYAVNPQQTPVTVGIDATFYDGTPASGLSFDLNDKSWAEADKYRLVTDENGHAQTNILFSDQNVWRPTKEYPLFFLDGDENETQSVEAELFAIYRDVMLETDFKKNGNTGTLKIKTSEINPEKLEPNLYFWGNENCDIIRGEAFDTAVTATLRRQYYEKVETGSYYDKIQKKTVKSYEYNWQEEYVDTFIVSTVDGLGEFDNLPLDKENSTYIVDLEWADTQGRPVQDSVYLYDESRYNNYNTSDYTFNTEKSTFKENEQVDFNLLYNNEEVKDLEGKVFYTTNAYDFLTVDVIDTPKLSYTMDSKCIPSVCLSGAYFDGKHVYPITSNYYAYNFDPSDRKIDLEIKSDKEKYKPGNTAEIKVIAKYKDGSPATNANISLSIVDEAAFAIEDQYVDTLRDVYAFSNIPQPVSFCSYSEFSLSDLNAGEGAEKGGGGDDYYIREDFKDTAAFLTCITNSDGTATLSFKVPDNLTTWRATVQAIGENSNGDIYAGNEKAPIVVSQPLFITPIALSQYVVGDDISFSAKCTGDESEHAKITAQVTGENFDKTLSAQEHKAMNFGKLPSGKYSVLFTAKNGDNKDAVKLNFEVVDSILETPVFKKFDLNSQKIDINPLRWPVNITFYNKDYMLYTDILSQFTSNWGERLDYRIADGYAGKKFGYISDEEYKEMFGDITTDGLANLLPNSDEDYELTALICVASPELVNKGSVSNAFYTKLAEKDCSPEDIVNCYLGLSALSEPVLSDVNQLLANYQDQFSYHDKLKLCAALANLGDYNGAYKYYSDLTKGMNITEKDNRNTEAYLIDSSLKLDSDIIGNTKYALLTASILNLPEADGMARYLYKNIPTDQTCVLELMTYLENYVPKSENDAVIQYTLDGKTETLTLDKFYGHSIYFGEDQLKSANIKVTSGNVMCTAAYTGPFTEKNNDQTIDIQKTYTSVNGGWGPGALIAVEITVPSATDGTVFINDVIPSGARYVKGGDETFISRSGQRTKIWLFDKTRAVYYIKLVESGEFVVESAVATDCDANWGKSQRDIITVD